MIARSKVVTFPFWCVGGFCSFHCIQHLMLSLHFCLHLVRCMRGYLLQHRVGASLSFSKRVLLGYRIWCENEEMNATWPQVFESIFQGTVPISRQVCTIPKISRDLSRNNSLSPMQFSLSNETTPLSFSISPIAATESNGSQIFSWVGSNFFNRNENFTRI